MEYLAQVSSDFVLYFMIGMAASTLILVSIGASISVLKAFIKMIGG